MNGSVFQVPRQHASTCPVVIHDEVECEILDEELCLVFEALLVQRVQDCVAGSVGSGTCSVRRTVSVMGGHAAEGSLVDFSCVGTGEGYAVVLEFDYCGPGLATHVFNRILVPEPVGTFNRVIHVPAPIVLAHVA